MFSINSNFYMFFFKEENKLPWRNWPARSAVNRKVGGSSPPGSDCFSPIIQIVKIMSPL